MTVLSACQDAAKLLRPSSTPPSIIFTSSDPFAIELAALSNEAATAIAKYYDWQKLITLKTQAGDGSATAFDLPSDYDRMLVKGAVFKTSILRPMQPVRDFDIWLDHRIRSYGIVDGEWIIFGGQINIEPALASTDSAKFYYVSNLIVTDEDTSTKSTFDADTDTFRLPERLLTLALIWRWRQRKGFDYAEDMRNYEIALAEEVNRDRGSHMVRVGMPRISTGAELAFPGVIVDA